MKKVSRWAMKAVSRSETDRADRVGVQLAVGGSAGLLAVIILYCLFLTSRIRSLD